MTATAPREYPRFTSLDLAVITSSFSRNSQSIGQYFGASSTTLEYFYFLSYLLAIESSPIFTTIKKILLHRVSSRSFTCARNPVTSLSSGPIKICYETATWCIPLRHCVVKLIKPITLCHYFPTIYGAALTI